MASWVTWTSEALEPLLMVETWREGHAQLLDWGGAFLRTLQGSESLAADHAPEAVGGNRPWPLALFLELAAIQFVFNFIMRACIKPVVRRAMLKVTHKPRKVSDNLVDKFAQSTMEAIFYICYFAIGFIIVRSQPWLWPSENWWKDQPDNSQIGKDAAFFYLAYGARYFQCFVMVFLETRRLDFLEMQIHHSVTTMLIYLSYSYGFVRIGLVIMVLLDVADPPLHLAKMFVYFKDISPKTGSACSAHKFFALVGDILFGTFALDFTFTRMMLYPYVVWSVTVELYRSKAGPGPFDFFDYWSRIGTKTVVCVFLVWVLMFLQIFWWQLLIKAIYNVFSGGKLKDNRSDSEASDVEDSDAAENTKKNR